MDDNINRDVQNEIKQELQKTYNKDDEFFSSSKNSLVLISETKHEMFQVFCLNLEIKTKLD
jgi:hypothetical protein